MSEYYILDGRDAKPADGFTWAKWLEEHRTDRHVADETRGDARISTVFLGLNHNFCGDGPPLIFETMVFGGPLDQEQERYSTWEQAEAGHAAMLARLIARDEEG